MRARRGFTLLEIAIVLIVMAIASALVIPAYSDLGQNPPAVPGSSIVTLLRDARKLAIEQSQAVSVHIDPTALTFRVDTTGVGGTGVYAEGSLAMSAYEAIETDRTRLEYVFRPTGAAIGDTIVVRGDIRAVISVDSWSGETSVYAR